VHEALWFGSKLQKSFLNPNQVRSHGLQVSDDPFDTNRPMGITDPATDEFIPAAIHGPNIAFETRVPRQDELATCDYIEH
jgi:hypothetical protein